MNSVTITYALHSDTWIDVTRSPDPFWAGLQNPLSAACMYLQLNFSSHKNIIPIVWADNADFCAKQYTGTGALKTDFTRYLISLVLYK